MYTILYLLCMMTIKKIKKIKVLLRNELFNKQYSM